MKLKTCLALVCGIWAISSAPAASKRAGEKSRSAEKLNSLPADLAVMQKSLAEPLLTAGAAGLGSPAVQEGLARHEFIRACGADKLTELSKREGGVAFLKAFLSNPAWIESLLISDPPAVSYAQAAENLRLLHRHGKALDEPVYQCLATAMALSGGKINPYLLVERFGQTQRAHREGLLHVSFDNLAVREMRWAIHLGGNANDYEYLLNDRQTRLRDYLGACWAVAYRGFNDYGDSIQGPWYHHAFRHRLPGWEAVRAVGGVCGSLSTYGALAARVHGVPAQTVGQPMHCAYVVRVEDSYPVGNSVTWPTSTSAPGWEGTGYATLARLYEPVSKDVPRLLAANRALWLAGLQIDQKRPPAEWLASFDRAILAQPLNYDTWLETAKALNAEPAVTAAERLEFARRASKTFAGYPEAAWGLVKRFADKALPALSKDERTAFLLERHADLREENADRYVDWPFEGMLDWQASALSKDPAVAVDYFGKVLAIHSEKAPHHHVFTRTMGWGQNRFATNPKTSALFAQAMEGYFKSRGDSADGAMVRNQITAGLQAASQANDLVTFRLWADMSAKLLPELRPEDVYLNTKQCAAFPAINPFAGEVLSQKGLLKTSSSNKYDRPLSYPAVLGAGGFGGYFDTNPEETPSATVQLPGQGKLSGVVIVDRAELSAEAGWSVPLKVSYSSDGKDWTEAATFSNAQPVYRVDLEGKEARAKFVKVERLPGRKERFHLRNILVFGTPLY